jgi:hypothetical protein
MSYYVITVRNDELYRRLEKSTARAAWTEFFLSNATAKASKNCALIVPVRHVKKHFEILNAFVIFQSAPEKRYEAYYTCCNEILPGVKSSSEARILLQDMHQITASGFEALVNETKKIFEKMETAKTSRPDDKVHSTPRKRTCENAARTHPPGKRARNHDDARDGFVRGVGFVEELDEDDEDDHGIVEEQNKDEAANTSPDKQGEDGEEKGEDEEDDFF